MNIRTVLLAVLLSAVAFSYPLPGTVTLTDNSTVFPGNSTGAVAGKLLASLIDPWSFSSTEGTTSGILTTAVYEESSGTLDFYYQVQNDRTSASSIARVSEVNFSSFQTSVAFRTDGGSLPGGIFINGTCGSIVGTCPQTSDRTGGVIGFSYGPTSASKIAPGETDFVFVISTNATNFQAGNAAILDGGSVTVHTFQPTSSVVPEPASMMLIGVGLLTLRFVRRK